MKRFTLGAAALALLVACNSDSTSDSSGSVVAGATASGAISPGAPSTSRTAAFAHGRAPSAATICAPSSFPDTLNLAVNPSFEAGGPPVTWPPGPQFPPSAATGWTMHSSNSNALVGSSRVPTTVPGPGGSKMLHFVAGGNEGGVYQQLANAPPFLMFSAWVFVRRGQVVIDVNAANTGPDAFTTKHGEWEQLRICTDGTVPTDFFAILNEDPAGGDFYVDRVEIRRTQ